MTVTQQGRDRRGKERAHGEGPAVCMGQCHLPAVSCLGAEEALTPTRAAAGKT